MKRYAWIGFILLFAIALSGCSLSTYQMDELLPKAIDDATLLPIIESVTVVRSEDGAQVTVEGPEVETFMLAFDGLVCTRKEAVQRPDVFEIIFLVTEGVETPQSLCIEKIESTGELILKYGAYDYYLVNTKLDIYYLESLFD